MVNSTQQGLSMWADEVKDSNLQVMIMVIFSSMSSMNLMVRMNIMMMIITNSKSSS